MRFDFFAFLLFLIFSADFFSESRAEIPIKKPGSFDIVIDPGHGGSDRGAIKGRLSEAEIVLAVGTELQKLLQAESTVESQMTRVGDQSRILLDRVKFAEDRRADLFVSIHANSNPSRSAQGAEFYIREGDAIQRAPASEKKAEKVSDVEAILADLKAQGQLKQSLLFSKQLKSQWSEDAKSAIRRAPFYVVSKTSMPSVLIEVGFMTNPAELRKLNSEDHRKELAQKIYKAILSYKEKVDRQKNQSLN